MMNYLRGLSTGRLILWCYFIWYAVVFVRYFDPNPRLWLTSLGLSGIIGVALYISTTSGTAGVRLGFWPVFRLFLMPFCVSSFSALVKGHGFLLVFSPKVAENALAILLCAAFCVIVMMIRRAPRKPADKNVFSKS